MVRWILTAAVGLCMAHVSRPADAAAQPAAAQPAASVRGKTLFESRCATCHGLDARGGQAIAIGRGSPAAAYTDDRLLTIIRAGKPGGMPGVGSPFPAADLIALVRHLRQLQRADAAEDAIVTGDPTAGRTLFFGKAACDRCHMAEGRGGFLGSDLTHTRLQANAIRQAIVHPDPSSRNRLTTLTLQDGTRIAGLVRNEDNFSIQLQDEHGAFHSIDKSSITATARDPKPLMPTDYSQRLSDADIQNLVRYIHDMHDLRNSTAIGARP